MIEPPDPKKPPAGTPKAAQALVAQVLADLQRREEPTVATLRLAQGLFAQVGDDALARWLDCEVEGYDVSVPLAQLLGVAEEDPLVSRVRGYRQYVGRVRTSFGAVRAMQVPYFFGESVAVLRHQRANANALGVDFIEVERVSATQAADPTLLPSGEPSRTLEFPRYTFYRILAGLQVEVEVAVRGVLQRLR